MARKRIAERDKERWNWTSFALILPHFLVHMVSIETQTGALAMAVYHAGKPGFPICGAKGNGSRYNVV
jgi:hypothetical protein